MPTPCPALHPKLEATLAALRAAGVEPTDAEIVWLGLLRERCDKPIDGTIPWVSGSPLEYAGIKFWPLHRLAEDWLQRAYELADDGDNDKIWLYLFAHSKSSLGDASLRDLVTAGQIISAVDKWARELPIHTEQLIALCERLIELDGGGKTVLDPGKTTDNDVVERDALPQFMAAMCKAFPGVSPDFWATDISAADARAMLAGIAENGCFADSRKRRHAIEQFLNAIKWVKLNHG